MSLADLARSASLLAERDQGSLLRRIRWTQPQLDFLMAMSVLPVLLRTGNQWLGKSTVAAADTLYRCQGDHPYDPRGRITPCAAGILSPTEQHSIGLQEKVWELADKSTLEPGQLFIPGKGMRGRYPILRFRNGSRITYRTANQGALALSGATLDHVLLDELVPPRIYHEMRKRIERRNGTMRLALTPINAPADWLREECAGGRILDLHYRCEARWCIPVGSTSPLCDPRTGIPMDQAWIDRFVASTDPNEVDVVVHGGWQIVHVDRSFAAWTDDLVFGDATPVPELQDLAVGIDYGEEPGRFVALLMARTVSGEVWILGEWVGTGREGAREAAEGIRGMIEGWGMPLASIRRWVGDVNSAGAFAGGRSMNELMQAEFRRFAAIEMQTAHKTRGSVDTRFQMLNSTMGSRRIRVHSSCRRVLEAVRQHRRGSQNAAKLKDPIDAVWYGAEPWIREIAPLPARIRMR